MIENKILVKQDGEFVRRTNVEPNVAPEVYKLSHDTHQHTQGEQQQMSVEVKDDSAFSSHALSHIGVCFWLWGG